MPDTTIAPDVVSQPGRDAGPTPVEELVEESLVEEVSIDGMCGVY